MRMNQAIGTWMGLVTLSLTAAAQNTPTLFNVASVQVKPDRVGEWMDVEKQFTAAYKKGGGTRRVVYRNSAGNPYEFMVITSVPSYAALDGKSPYAKGTTETELARMTARRGQCVDSVRVTYERLLADLSFNPPGTPTPSKMAVARVTVRPDMTAQWMATIKDELIPAVKKAGQTGLVARRVEWGGSRNVFTLRAPLGKSAELDGDPPYIKTLGPDASAKLNSKIASMASTEWMIYTFEPELSFLPQP